MSSKKQKKPAPMAKKFSIDETIEDALSGLATDIKQSKGLERAKLVSRLIELSESMRKRDAARKKALVDFSIPTVVLWARGLEPGERVELVRDLQAIDTKRSGLA